MLRSPDFTNPFTGKKGHCQSLNWRVGPRNLLQQGRLKPAPALPSLLRRLQPLPVSDTKEVCLTIPTLHEYSPTEDVAISGNSWPLLHLNPRHLDSHECQHP